MTDPKLKVSAAGDIRRPAPELVELPHAQNGRKLVFLLRPLNIDELGRAEGGPPAMPPELDGSRKLTSRESLTAADTLREIGRAGIVEPRINFGPGEDSPHWDDLSAGNQGAVVTAIYRLSGIGQSKDGEAAKSTVGFPAEPGGKEHGAPRDPAVRAGAAPA
jgi:hypothetical protein